jgi:hypothetical protein
MNGPLPLCRAVVFVPLLVACYAQRPLTTPVPAPTTRIVAQLTDSGVVAMSNAIGAGAVEVEGVVAGADAATWELEMVRVDYRGGVSAAWKRERVRFPRYALTHPTERTYSKKRSWVAAALITVGALLGARLFGAFGGGGGPDDGPPPPPN